MSSNTGTTTTSTTDPSGLRATTVRRVRHGALVLGLCASLSVGALSFGAAADAKGNSGGGTKPENTCQQIKKNYDTDSRGYNDSTSTLSQDTFKIAMQTDRIEFKNTGCKGDIADLTIWGPGSPVTSNGGAIQAAR